MANEISKNLPAVQQTSAQVAKVDDNDGRAMGPSGVDLAKLLAGNGSGVSRTGGEVSNTSLGGKALKQDTVGVKNSMDCMAKGGGFCTEEKESSGQNLNFGI